MVCTLYQGRCSGSSTQRARLCMCCARSIIDRGSGTLSRKRHVIKATSGPCASTMAVARRFSAVWRTSRPRKIAKKRKNNGTGAIRGKKTQNVIMTAKRRAGDKSNAWTQTVQRPRNTATLFIPIGMRRGFRLYTIRGPAAKLCQAYS